MATSSAMDQFDESMKKQISSLLRVMNLVKSFKEDNIPCKIDEGLFLGSVGTAANKKALKSLNVTHILTVAGKLPPAHPGDFVYKIIDVIDKDDVNIKQYFNECFDFIDEAKRHGGAVLVHCFAGKSRSVTVVVAYLMKTREMSLSEALQHVKSRRPLAAPNPGFIRQLEDFEKLLQGVPLNETWSAIWIPGWIQHNFPTMNYKTWVPLNGCRSHIGYIFGTSPYGYS